MRKVLRDELVVPLPAHAERGDFKTELALVAMKTLDPDATAGSVLKALRKAHMLENSEHTSQIFVDSEMMRDVLVQSEIPDACE